MTELRRIIGNTVISLFGQGLSWLSTLLLSFAYGHFLGDTKFGELYSALTFVYLIGVPVDYGYNNQIIRDVAPEPSLASRYFSNMLLIKLGSWFIMYAIMLLVSWQLGYTVEVRVLIAICGFDLLTNVIADTFGALYCACQKNIFPSVASILEKGISTLLGTLLLSMGGGVTVMALVLVGGSLVNLIWQASWFFHQIGVSFVIDAKLIRKVIRTNIPFLMSGLLTVGYSSIDTVLLSIMTNSAVVGWYGAASRITDAMNVLPSIVIVNVMYPVFSKLSTTSDLDLKLALEKTINFLLFCAIPISTILLVAAPEIIVFLYGGKDFTQSVSTLQALAPYVCFLFFDYPLVSILLSKKLDKRIPLISIIGLIFNLTLNIFLIPIYRQLGSAVIASLTELLLCFICVVFIPRHLRPTGSWPVVLKILTASLIMALVVLFLHTWPIFVFLPIAMLVYFGASLLFGAIPREDYQALYHAIRYKAKRSSSTDDALGIPVPLYDLPTMLVPAYYHGGLDKRGSLLDIGLAVTGELPVIRLPLAPQRTGLITNAQSKFPTKSYALPRVPALTQPASDGVSTLGIDTMVTENLPIIHLYCEQDNVNCIAKDTTRVVASDGRIKINEINFRKNIVENGDIIK